MSEPRRQQDIDWSKWDLLDACYAYDTIDPQLLTADVGHGSSNYSTRLTAKPLTSARRVDAEAAAPKMTIGPPDNMVAEEVSSGCYNDTPYAQNTPSSTEVVAVSSKVIELKCAQCDSTFKNDHGLGSWRMSCHAKECNHLAFRCSVASCSQKFITSEEKAAHERRPHTEGHERVHPERPFDCVECEATLSSKAELLRHARLQQHQPYGCTCGKHFSRLDVLNRHLEIYDTDLPRFPCSYCKLHRGKDGFKRADHLKQHLRNYHNHELEDEERLKWSLPVCSHADCPDYRDENFKSMSRSEREKTKPFKTQAAYTKHMRDEHNECTFPCDIAGCSRIGRKGYFREKDLLKHRKEQHPDAPFYSVKERETTMKCPLGCGKSFKAFDPALMNCHVKSTCRSRSSRTPNLVALVSSEAFTTGEYVEATK